MEPWVVYILECADKTYYVGTTNNRTLRVEKHNSGKGAKYTRGRGPVKLKYVMEYESHSEACKQEYELKQHSRAEKHKLITAYQKKLKDGKTHKKGSAKTS
jgi:putative endonuclease